MLKRNTNFRESVFASAIYQISLTFIYSHSILGWDEVVAETMTHVSLNHLTNARPTTTFLVKLAMGVYFVLLHLIAELVVFRLESSQIFMISGQGWLDIDNCWIGKL